jgi:hypothetical protein
VKYSVYYFKIRKTKNQKEIINTRYFNRVHTVIFTPLDAQLNIVQTLLKDYIFIATFLLLKHRMNEEEV